MPTQAKLELARNYWDELGRGAARGVGLATAPVHSFTDFDTAIAFVAAHPRRYVLKFDDTYLTSDANYVGMRDDGADVAAIMTRYRRQWQALDEAPPAFLLMHHLRGVEVGVGRFFDGARTVIYGSGCGASRNVTSATW